MQTYSYRVRGEETVTHFPEHRDELDLFYVMLHTTAVIGLDTETTGLNIYSAGFACRLVQFGNAREAWVLRADLFGAEIREVLADQSNTFVAHNATFDLLVLDRVGFASLDELGPRVYDTQVLAHLLDPRSADENGTGLSLKGLAAVHVDEDAPDTADGLKEVFRKEYKATIKTGWSLIDIDHPTYVLYAGLDVILVTRLLRELGVIVKGANLTDLAKFEHRVQLLTARMQRRGVLVDVPYTRGLSSRLEEERAEFAVIAASYGVENVNSTKQVVEALQGMGEAWSDKTDSGNPAVGKEVLLPMADLDRDWDRIERRDPNPLADAVLRSKRAGKWRGTYAESFLELRDEGDRIHPSIRALAARTARMSISTPPLQQLPSSDWTIRRAIIADPGKTIVAADYAQVEMRVLAALANVKEMKRAIAEGRSIHEFTAAMLFGDDYPKWKYKIAKNTGFAKVFGGGVGTIMKTSGAGRAEVAEVVAQYNGLFPEIATYGRLLQSKAGHGRMEVVTPFGRHLPLDKDRAYAATNYVVQSTARDLLAKAIVDVHQAGLGDHLLLPVHDELVCQADTADAADVAHEIGRAMESTFRGVRIDSESSVYGPSWGHGYGAP